MSRRNSLGHQCHVCRRPWALRVVDHPSGTAVVCRYCGAVRATAAPRTTVKARV